MATGGALGGQRLVPAREGLDLVGGGARLGRGRGGQQQQQQGGEAHGGRKRKSFHCVPVTVGGERTCASIQKCENRLNPVKMCIFK